MLDTVNGLPTHVLLVHGVVVLVPLAAVLLVLAAALGRVQARLGLALPALAALCAVLVPVTARAGESLRERIGGGGPLVERHEHLAEALLPWVIGVLVLSVVVVLRGRQRPAVGGSARIRVPAGTAGAARTSLLLDLVVLVLSVAVGLGAVVQVVRVGESGSRAVWDGVGSSNP